MSWCQPQWRGHQQHMHAHAATCRKHDSCPGPPASFSLACIVRPQRQRAGRAQLGVGDRHGILQLAGHRLARLAGGRGAAAGGCACCRPAQLRPQLCRCILVLGQRVALCRRLEWGGAGVWGLATPLVTASRATAALVTGALVAAALQHCCPPPPPAYRFLAASSWGLAKGSAMSTICMGGGGCGREARECTPCWQAGRAAPPCCLLTAGSDRVPGCACPSCQPLRWQLSVAPPVAPHLRPLQAHDGLVGGSQGGQPRRRHQLVAELAACAVLEHQRGPAPGEFGVFCVLCVWGGWGHRRGGGQGKRAATHSARVQDA